MKAKKIYEEFKCSYCGYLCTRTQIYKQSAIYAPMSQYPHFFNIEGLPKTLDITFSTETLIDEQIVAPNGEFTTVYLNVGKESPLRYIVGYICPKCKEISNTDAHTQSLDSSYEYV